LELPQKHLEKVSTTTDPFALPAIATKFVPKQRLWAMTDEQKQAILKWYDRAIRKKLKTYCFVRHALLATGNALLIETNNFGRDKVMTCGVSEPEVKSSVYNNTIIFFMHLKISRCSFY